MHDIDALNKLIPLMINTNDLFHPELLTILKSITVNSCPKNINLHCHTIYSDGSMEPEDLFLQACDLGLEHLAITDHHNIQAYNEIKNTLLPKFSLGRKHPYLWSGIEISSLLNNCLVHILGLGFDHSHRSLKPYINGEAPVGHLLSADSVINAIHDSGGLAILAHPARYRLPYDFLIDKANQLGIDGIETWYDYDYKTKWSASQFICEKIHLKILEYNLLSTCGTDSHGFDLKSR